MDKAAFTVIIPNYNGLKYMEECMSALAAQTYDSFVVLIVDNGSTDGSVEYLKELERSWMTEAGMSGKAGTDSSIDSRCNSISSNASSNTHTGNNSNNNGISKGNHGTESDISEKNRRLSCIYLDTNTGFSGAVNAGIAAADTEYIVLLNNDTKADRNYLKELARVFEADKDKHIFAVSPKMIQMYHPELLDDAGDGLNLLGWAFQRGVGQPVDKPKFNRVTEVFSACAGAAAYRKSVFEEMAFKGEEAAYFDPMHFAYLEDVDVSFRARVLGYDIVYAPSSVVYHVGSGTSGSKYNQFKVRLAARNNIYLFYKNMPLLMLLLNLPGIAVGIMIKCAFFSRLGFGREYREGLSEGFSKLGSCRAHKSGFRLSRLLNYIDIELRLIADTFSYVQDFAVRQVAKIRK